MAGVKSDASAAKSEPGSPEKAAGQAEYEGAVVHVDGAAASGGICRFAVRSATIRRNGPEMSPRCSENNQNLPIGGDV